MSFLARVRASEPALVACALVAALVCAALFLLQGRLGVNLQDEAFLWYGAIRTHAGELPLRDVRAYDPGRYFWCAGWMAVFGDGLVAVRAAGWAFASLGVAAGLLVVSRATRGIAWIAVAGVVLAVWMSPPWKLFESSLAMLVAWIAVRLVEKPTSGRRLAAGIAVEVDEPESALARAIEIAAVVASKPPVAVRLAKEAVRRALEVPLTDAIEADRQAFALLAASDDRREGIAAFLEKRPPTFTGR